MINTVLLQNTLEFIVANPERWDQASYRNPSGQCCFIGLAAELAGYEWVSEPNVANEAHFDVLTDEGPKAVWDIMRTELGLDVFDWLHLIHALNTLEDLKNLVSEFTIKAVDDDIAELRDREAASLHA